jgi:alkylhydroperoxidase/carboxymuconolactone decarboxylase family protein YurZ
MHEHQQDWRAVVDRFDAALATKASALEGYAARRDSKIPRKYRELILMACAAGIRYRTSVRDHGFEAMYQGASDEEVIEALSLASTLAGFTAFIEGIEALGDRLTVDPVGDGGSQ